MAWTEDRLHRLFEYYNRRFWQGELPAFKIVLGPLDSARGQWNPKKRVITINAERHKNDRDVRSTLLHEMCHAADPQSLGHDDKFFAQLEKLLERGAPIGVGAPEAGGVDFLQGVVTSRFPLVKRRMDRAEARRRKPIYDFIRAAKHLKVIDIDEEDILHEFEESAWEYTWRQARIVIGRQHGLVYENGRPLKNRWAADILKRAETAHRRGRRRYLDDQYARARPRTRIDSTTAAPDLEHSEAEGSVPAHNGPSATVGRSHNAHPRRHRARLDGVLMPKKGMVL